MNRRDFLHAGAAGLALSAAGAAAWAADRKPRVGRRAAGTASATCAA
jgi:hypothetical protein